MLPYAKPAWELLSKIPEVCLLALSQDTEHLLVISLPDLAAPVSARRQRPNITQHDTGCVRNRKGG
jgi:hypothetical protein